ncbi:MAG: NAD(P)/FAD-dependent oxidoreductase [Pyrinomonadaceae bacterium]
MSAARTPNQAESFAIVGGGMLGLTLALRLVQAGKCVTVYEAAGELGGLASAWHLGDIVWDRHYHVTLLSDTALRRVLTELGLEKEMEWVETRTGFYTDGKLVSMSNTVEFLRFPPLGLIGKLRLGATIFYASRITDWKRLEQIPVADWLTKLSGKRTFERMWLPLLRAKLGESYRRASAAFIWATIARMYAARRTGLKKEMFGYVPGGYARILERFGARLNELGVTIKLNCPVDRVTRSEGGARVEAGDGTSETFDQVIVTAPGSVAARMLPELSTPEKELLNGVEYQGIVCASLLLRQPLAGFYVTNITDQVPFTAVIEMSALVDRNKYFNGQALVYLPKYVAPDDPIFDLSDDELRSKFVTALEGMYPHFRADDVIEFKVSRVRRVFPLPTLNYSARLPPLETSIPGVQVVNSAHIVNGTLNVNETVQLAERAAEMLLSTATVRDIAGQKAAA